MGVHHYGGYALGLRAVHHHHRLRLRFRRRRIGGLGRRLGDVDRGGRLLRVERDVPESHAPAEHGE